MVQKFLFISDLHVGTIFPYLIDQQTGISARSLDLISPLNQLYDYIKHKDDLFTIFIAGDLYDKVNPNPNHRKLVIEQFKKLARLAKIHVIGGNHDTPRELHRACSLDELGLIENVVIHRNIEAFSIGNVGFLLMPFIRPSYVAQLLSETLGKEMPVENRDEIIFEEIKKKIDEVIGEIKDCEKKIAVTHYFIKGMKYDSGYEFGKNEFMFSQEFFSGFDAVFAGHVHKPQTFQNVTVIGSPEIITLSEIGQKKRFIEMDADAIITEIPTMFRKHVVLHLEYAGESSIQMNDKIREILKGKKVRNAVVIVKVRCKLNERQAILANLDYTAFNGAFYVHSPVFENVDELQETAVGEQLMENSDEGNFLSYFEHVISQDTELDDGLKEEIKRKGLEIIKEVELEEEDT